MNLNSEKIYILSPEDYTIVDFSPVKDATVSYILQRGRTVQSNI